MIVFIANNQSLLDRALPAWAPLPARKMNENEEKSGTEVTSASVIELSVSALVSRCRAGGLMMMRGRHERMAETEGDK